MKNLNKKNIIILSIIIIIVIIIIVFIVRKKKKTRDSVINNGISNGNNSGSNFLNTKNDNFPLKLGSSGAKVLELQKALNKFPNVSPKLTQDGIFGENTRLAVLTVTNNRFDQVIDQAALNQILNYYS